MTVPRGRLEVLRAGGVRFDEGGCILDVDGDGRKDLVLTEAEPRALVWYRAQSGGWVRHLIDAGVDALDLLPATLHGRRGVLLVHRRSQVRFYEIAADPAQRWHSRDIYSFYSHSGQGGLAMGDVDDDSLPDIFCGNYWIQSPKSFELPWRLFAINLWNETANSGVMSLVAAESLLLVVQREMSPGRIAWFEKPADPRQLWTERRVATDATYPVAMQAADSGDVLVGERGGANRMILLSRRQPHVIGRASRLRRAFAADLNGDTKRDLVVISGESIAWWEQR